jgi:hypothetical protein
MKTLINVYLLLLAATSTFCFLSCSKSSSNSSVSTVSPATLAGNWAAELFINSTNGHADTAFLSGTTDTLVFNSTGGLNAFYYVQGFDTATSHVIYTRIVDTASYVFVNDSTIHVSGKTSLYLANNSSDIFIIQYLDSKHLQMYAPDQGGSGGYLYVYSKF